MTLIYIIGLIICLIVTVDLIRTNIILKKHQKALKLLSELYILGIQYNLLSAKLPLEWTYERLEVKLQMTTMEKSMKNLCALLNTMDIPVYLREENEKKYIDFQ